MENHSQSLNERVQNIKNNEELEKLIVEYKPFIASVTQSAAGKFVHFGVDDELSIALIAFEEAVKSYDSSKGNFLSFAKNVIKRRLIDYYRKENRHKDVISLDQKINNDEEQNEDFDLSSEIAVKRFSERELAEARRNEIAELKTELDAWGISFFDVANSSPKHDKTRKICIQIINQLLQHNELVAQMKKKKYLPVAEIEKVTKLPRKNIERARNYIIAVILIKTGDYQYINDFVDWR